MPHFWPPRKRLLPKAEFQNKQLPPVSRILRSDIRSIRGPIEAGRAAKAPGGTRRHPERDRSPDFGRQRSETASVLTAKEKTQLPKVSRISRSDIRHILGRIEPGGGVERLLVGLVVVPGGIGVRKPVSKQPWGTKPRLEAGNIWKAPFQHPWRGGCRRTAGRSRLPTTPGQDTPPIQPSRAPRHSVSNRGGHCARPHPCRLASRLPPPERIWSFDRLRRIYEIHDLDDSGSHRGIRSSRSAASAEGDKYGNDVDALAKKNDVSRLRIRSGDTLRVGNLLPLPQGSLCEAVINVEQARRCCILCPGNDTDFLTRHEI